MWKCIMSGSLALCHGLLPVAASDHASVSAYNVVWDSPSKDFNGSMPLGNGDIGANVWVGQEGEIHLLISKTDSWGGCGRLLKVGKVRVRCEPALVSPGSSFLQTLDNPHFPALRSSPRLRQAGRSGPLALSGASRRKQTPSSQLNTHGTRVTIVPLLPDANCHVTTVLSITEGPIAKLFGRLVAVKAL